MIKFETNYMYIYRAPPTSGFNKLTTIPDIGGTDK